MGFPQHTGRTIPLDKSRLRGLTKRLVHLLILAFKVAARSKANDPIRWREVWAQTTYQLPLVKGGEDVDVDVVVAAGKDTRQGPYVHSGGFGHNRRSQRPIVIVKINGSYTAREYIDIAESKILDDRIYGILVHEMTHAADVATKAQYEVGSAGGPYTTKDLKSYYNDPKEVRAYMQQVVDEVLSFGGKRQNVDKMLKLFGPENERGRQRGVEVLLKNTETWSEVEKHLNFTNRKKILKAVYRALVDEGHIKQASVTKVAARWRDAATLPKYIGVFLTPQSRRALLREYPPVHPVVHADHITLIYEPTEADLELVELGSLVKLRAKKYFVDDKAQAISLELPPELARISRRDPHITISTTADTQGVYSNKLIKGRGERAGQQYTGIVDAVSRQHKVHTPRFPLASMTRVATLWRQARDYFEVGDPILYGKYKNKKGRIVAWGKDHKGNPTVEIEPIPKGRKKNKVFGLFKIWKNPPPAIAEQMAEQQMAEVPKTAKSTAKDAPVWGLISKELEGFNKGYQRLKKLESMRGDKLVAALNKPAERKFWDTFIAKTLGPFSAPRSSPKLSHMLGWVRRNFGLPGARDVGDKMLDMMHALDVMDRPEHFGVEPERAVKNAIQTYDVARKAVQKKLDQVGPDRLTYQGFKIRNWENFAKPQLRKALDVIDYLVAMFRKRGVEKLLSQTINTINLSWLYEGDPTGYAMVYQAANRAVGIFLAHFQQAQKGRVSGAAFAHESIVHELGHHVHLSYLHPDAKAEWDAGWNPVDSAREKIDQTAKVTFADRKKFFDLIKRSGWDPKKAGRKLKGIDRMKFLGWLYNPAYNRIISTPGQVRLTGYGRNLFEFFKDPDAWGRKTLIIEDEGQLQEAIKKQYQKKLEVLFLTPDWGTLPLDSKTVEQIRKEDKTVDAALDALELPSQYARTNVKEDFADTFAAFIIDPAKLSKQARYRMERVLSLSGLYGKPVMRIADKARSGCVAEAYRRRKAL